MVSAEFPRGPLHNALSLPFALRPCSGNGRVFVPKFYYREAKKKKTSKMTVSFAEACCNTFQFPHLECDKRNGILSQVSLI